MKAAAKPKAKVKVKATAKATKAKAIVLLAKDPSEDKGVDKQWRGTRGGSSMFPFTLALGT